MGKQISLILRGKKSHLSKYNAI
ncbi:hypothetical protein Pint_07161 [Pistacia integerrima]|uniref:Uncharacterized protein n=1 Tax=Pistacia integerrima TaxID=434235 RepID=A0ACC0XVM6_9ROSI|nr:hypothetical protein Pint_07161 [Pistacia integerrima]